MIICRTIEEFIEDAIEYGMSKVDFEDSSKYDELVKHLNENINYDNTGDYLLILGSCYFYGKGAILDLKQAVSLYKKASEKNNAKAQFNLGYCYQYGKGATKDLEQAIHWYKKSADQGNATAQNNLGYCYEHGEGVTKDLEQAIYWYKKSADQDNATAQFNLGEYYSNCYMDDIFEDDLKKQLLSDEQENGFEVDRVVIIKNNCYEKNKIGDLEQAFYWYKKAAEQGHLESQKTLGNFYEYGKGVKKNLEKAFFWYKKAAEQGDFEAQCNFGLCYEYGKGVEKNLKEALSWYKKAAEKGYPEACCYLGDYYYFGKGVEKNLERSLSWYKKAAKYKNSYALYMLGNCYYRGEGVDTDKKQAVDYYSESASRLNLMAQYTLATCYENGDGVEKDLEEALNWYELATALGCEEAKESYERLKKQIEKEKQKETLHISEKKDVFISWNHNDKKIKDEICNILEEKGYCTVWESDGSGLGDIEECVKNAILSSKSYIILVSENSIKSEWVKKEIEIIFEKTANNEKLQKCIRPVYLNNSEKFLNILDESNPFKKMNNLCSGFAINGNIDVDLLIKFVRNAIDVSLKYEYKEKLINKYKYFSSALQNRVNKMDSKSGIIAATLDFENGYINRPLYEDNNKYNGNVFNETNPVLIYGEGGSGKSLYLKNLLRKEFIDNRYLFFLPTKDIDDVIDSEKLFVDILREKAFNLHFAKTEGERITSSGFEGIFSPSTEVYILIDALDEINEEKKKILLEKLGYFKDGYPNIHYIFSSRNAADSNLLTEYLHQSIKALELKGLNKEDIHKLFNSLSKKYLQKESNNILDKVTWESFSNSLELIEDDIKKNPLLISNLIFIYLVSNNVPNKSFEILTESVNIMVKDIEEDRNITFDYSNYLSNNNLLKLLGYLAYCRVDNSLETVEELFRQYMEDTQASVDNIEHASKEIAKYLRRRSIIIGENISHDIFRDYFVALYIFGESYIKSGRRPKIGYSLKKDNDINILDDYIDYNLSNGDTWKIIATDLLLKLDLEIHSLDSKVEMNKNHLSYEAFNYTLEKYLSDNGVSKEVIDLIEKSVKRNHFFYNEFIKNKLNNK